MPRLSLRYVLLSAASGAAWACVAWLFWPRVSAPPIGVAMAASPVIGIVIGVAFRWIHRLPPNGRIAVSLVSLYVAASLFGLVVGWSDLMRLRAHGATNVAAAEIILQAVPAVLWGLTFTGYVAVMWPLAYFNHYLIRRLTE